MREVAVEEDGGDDGRIGSGIDFGFGSRRLGHELGPTECHRVGPEPGIGSQHTVVAMTMYAGVGRTWRWPEGARGA